MALSVYYFGLPFSNRHWILVIIRFMIFGFFSILIPSSPQKRVCLNWNLHFPLASWVNQSAHKIWFHSLVLKFIYHLNSLFPFPSLKYKRIYLYIIIFFFLFGSVLFYFIPYRFSTSPNVCGGRLERVIHPHVDLFWSMLRWIHHRVTCSTWSHDPKKMKRNSMMDESLGSGIYEYIYFFRSWSWSRLTLALSVVEMKTKIYQICDWVWETFSHIFPHMGMHMRFLDLCWCSLL